AVAWNKALIQAARWANSNKQAVIEFGQTKVPGITADKAWGLYDYYIKLGMWPVNGGMSKELVYGDHELWAKSKDMAPMPYEKWGTNEFQDKALAEIGKQ
ncbi:MAG: hypothetical protein HYY09_08690, partial [Firmicutes bacterium]|nr:hypothetical protein [Bacillota bacterium]